MPGPIKRRGYWWNTMGFTRTHLVGVMMTETLLCIAGIVLACGSIFWGEQHAIRLLLGALCAIGLAIAVILASILSLLFYAAWPIEDEETQESKAEIDPFA